MPYGTESFARGARPDCTRMVAVNCPEALNVTRVDGRSRQDQGPL